ncbi:MAG: SIR2 family protein [Acidimicrobiales bacterium]
MSSNEPGNEVVILGAGFSRAANSSMPLVKELGQEVLERLRADSGGSGRLSVLLAQLERTLLDADAAAASPGFEAWLARLAEDQPYARQSENLERRALFSRVSEVMWEVMVERQDKALTSSESKDPSLEPKEWLYDIVSLLHQRRSTVITLNYDNLVEHAAVSSFLWGEPTMSWTVGRAVRADDLFDGLPPFHPPVEVAVADEPIYGKGKLRMAPKVETLHLLKLHGSLSWFWSPTDPSGTTLAAWNVAEFGSGLRDELVRRQDLPGREPFLVPPTTSKASYFETMVTRELWRRAYEALKAAKRVVLVGYSLPTADSTFLGLLEDAIAGRDVEVVVVDTKPEPVKAQLKRLGVKSEPAEYRDIKTWVDDEVERSSRQVVEQLRSLAEDPAGCRGEATLMVGWIVSTLPTVEAYDVKSDGDGGLVLDTDPGAGRPYGTPLKFSEVKPLLASVKRIVAKIGDRRFTLTKLNNPGPMSPGVRTRLGLIPVGRPKA